MTHAVAAYEGVIVVQRQRDDLMEVQHYCRQRPASEHSPHDQTRGSVTQTQFDCVSVRQWHVRPGYEPYQLSMVVESASHTQMPVLVGFTPVASDPSEGRLEALCIPKHDHGVSVTTTADVKGVSRDNVKIGPGPTLVWVDKQSSKLQFAIAWPMKDGENISLVTKIEADILGVACEEAKIFSVLSRDYQGVVIYCVGEVDSSRHIASVSCQNPAMTGQMCVQVNSNIIPKEYIASCQCVTLVAQAYERFRMVIGTSKKQILAVDSQGLVRSCLTIPHLPLHICTIYTRLGVRILIQHDKGWLLANLSSESIDYSWQNQQLLVIAGPASRDMYDNVCVVHNSDDSNAVLVEEQTKCYDIHHIESLVNVRENDSSLRSKAIEKFSLQLQSLLQARAIDVKKLRHSQEIKRRMLVDVQLCLRKELSFLQNNRTSNTASAAVTRRHIPAQAVKPLWGSPTVGLESSIVRFEDSSTPELTLEAKILDLSWQVIGCELQVQLKFRNIGLLPCYIFVSAVKGSSNPSLSYEMVTECCMHSHHANTRLGATATPGQTGELNATWAFDVESSLGFPVQLIAHRINVNERGTPTETSGNEQIAVIKSIVLEPCNFTAHTKRCQDFAKIRLDCRFYWSDSAQQQPIVYPLLNALEALGFRHQRQHNEGFVGFEYGNSLTPGLANVNLIFRVSGKEVSSISAVVVRIHADKEAQILHLCTQLNGLLGNKIRVAVIPSKSPLLTIRRELDDLHNLIESLDQGLSVQQALQKLLKIQT